MRTFLAAFAFQNRLVWRTPDTLQVCFTAPLLTLIFLAISEHAGRGDLAPYGVVAPTLMSLWTVVFLFAGQIITDERVRGTLEGLVAAPVRLAVVVVGRLVAVGTVSLVAFVEAWLVAGLVFDRWVALHHPVVFVTCLIATALAMAGTATILSPLFVLLPSARILQNSLSYPFYLLGGVIVPVTLLPGWLQPASRVIFLSWASDVLRDSLSADPVRSAAARILVVVGLGAAGYALGVLLLNRVLLRVRRTGTLSRTHA